MSNQSLSGFGYFGKVPAKGDFVQGGLTGDFINPWSEWLTAAMAVSREQQHKQWLDLYLTSPIWHFALSADVCGSQAIVGTLMPSIDKVGRHFYFTIAKPVLLPPIAYWADKEWSQHSEDKVLRLLEDDTSVMGWAESLAKVEWLKEHSFSSVHNHATQQQQVLSAAQDFTPNNLAHIELRQRYNRYCMWWTEGSDHVDKCTLITDGLPLVSQFSAMLDGQWERWGW